MTNINKESRLLSMSAKLLAIAIQTAQAGSAQSEVRAAAALHDAEKLYPKMTISSPHGGGGIRLEVMLCDPETDEPVVRLIEIEGKDAEAIWAN